MEPEGVRQSQAEGGDRPNGRVWEERSAEWRSRLAIAIAGFLLFSVLSGLAILLLPFSVPNQITVILHTVVGLGFIVPAGWYLVRHWLRYWQKPISHIQVLGYAGGVLVALCGVSGVVLTTQAALRARISYAWDAVHILTTFALVAFVVPHVLLIALRERKAKDLAENGTVLQAATHYAKGTLLWVLVFGALVALGWLSYRPLGLRRGFPPDYSFKYGKGRPFAPSLATTVSGHAMDARLLSGSRSCGASGCHEQIVKEWEVSTHRYSAMDVAFQAIQTTMAKQNGPESTRYCGGCHDPISLFSGTKNLFIKTEELTSLQGFQEGVSCLVCHSVRQVDVKGNANYVVAEPTRYMFELEYDQRPTAASRLLRDFLIRAYPRQHDRDLGKTLFKTPEYCAACHKQFIDKEINNVGWVQLQNQYDNWRESHWNHPGSPRKTIECRECHMPLAPGADPGAGLASDYNHSSNDRMHRSHRFVAANQIMPALLKLPGWESQVALTERWLQGRYDIPEIADKWAKGPAVGLELIAPKSVRPGEKVDVRLLVTSNKVGHDFPTGPLDIIQAWVEIVAVDEQGKVVFASGQVDSRGFIQPGTFMFKTEPVDQNGNLIDRHNLWEMVGVRYRRSLFPGFSDTAEFSFLCPQLAPVRAKKFPLEVSYRVGVPQKGTRTLRVSARLCYRKFNQYLLNLVFGEHSGLTSPITTMTAQSTVVEVIPGSR